MCNAMKTLIALLLTTILFCSCSTDKQSTDSGKIIPSDSTLNLQTASQNLRIAVDKSGRIEYIEINPDESSQVIYFDSLGQVQELSMKKDSLADQIMYFSSSGQLKEVISYHNEEARWGAQFIQFAPSSTKSLLINHDKSSTPLICGLVDTFDIDTDYKLLFRTLDDRNDESFVEIRDLLFDTNFISIKVDKSMPNEFTISSHTRGTFRIHGTLSTTFPKPSLWGVLSRFDFNVTFN